MSAQNTESPPVFQNLKFTEAGRKRLDEVLGLFTDLEPTHSQATRARTELVERLLYLENFGGTVSDTDPRRRFEVTLGWEMYPLCFAITWKTLCAATGEYVFSMNGGLVWHGGGVENGSVCLDPEQLWSIHT